MPTPEEIASAFQRAGDYRLLVALGRSAARGSVTPRQIRYELSANSEVSLDCCLPAKAIEVSLDPEVAAELREFMPATAGRFVVSSEIKFKKQARGWKEFEVVRERPPRNDCVRPYSRCQPVFEQLNGWLRKKGIRANKPLHALRKEVGAQIATERGIYAASRFLRHSDNTTTARHHRLCCYAAARDCAAWQLGTDEAGTWQRLAGFEEAARITRPRK